MVQLRRSYRFDWWSRSPGFRGEARPPTLAVAQLSQWSVGLETMALLDESSLARGPGPHPQMVDHSRPVQIGYAARGKPIAG